MHVKKSSQNDTKLKIFAFLYFKSVIKNFYKKMNNLWYDNFIDILYKKKR